MAPFRAPKTDEASYKFINLENGLKALVVSDPTAEKAACAADVRVGSMEDPLELPGLAHFLEHMLFYSSARYPEEDAYSKFISSHGGKTNAYTAAESTNYHFDVNPGALEEAVDRFAQFFISPLISADGVDRESNAVDSEHSKNLNSDAWRRHQLWKHLSNPAHPFSHFSTGNLNTLINIPREQGVDVHQRLKEFYAGHYSASIMKVALIGPQSIEELEALVSDKFSSIPNKGHSAIAYPSNAVEDCQLCKLIKVLPVKDASSVEIQWPTISETEHYRAAPLHYISHLLGHEGEGSAFSMLRKKGFASSLVAGEAGSSFSTRSFFMCRVELTEQGQLHVPEVLGIIFSYLKLLAEGDGISVEIWSEANALANLKFDYRDTPSPYSQATSLSVGMQVYNDQDLLESLHNISLEFKPDLILSVLNEMIPERARIMWASRLLESDCDCAEPVYGSKYSEGSIPSEWMSMWNTMNIPEGLRLPDPNPFIPDNVALIEVEKGAEPTEIFSSDMMRLWYKADPSYKSPKAVLVLHIHLCESYVSPESAVMTNMLARLVTDSLTEISYPAELAGLHYSVRATVQGIVMSLSGFADALPRLSEIVLDTILMRRFKEDRYDIIKEKLLRDFSNRSFDQPYSTCLYEAAVALESKRWHIDDYEKVLPYITLQMLEKFLAEVLFKRAWCEMYVTGNVLQGDVTAIAENVVQHLKTSGASPMLQSQMSEVRVVRLEKGRQVVLSKSGADPNNDNSAVLSLFQIGQDNLKTNVLCELLVHIGKREAFYQLRTVEQLGYLTFCMQHFVVTARSLAFLIQSSSYSAAYLESRIDAFLPILKEKLWDLTDVEFHEQVEELATSKLEKPKKLRDAAQKDWSEIDDGTLHFNRQEEEVAELRRLSKIDFLSFCEEYLWNGQTQRQLRVRIQAPSQASNENGKPHLADVDIVTDVFAWRRHQELFASQR